MRLGRRDELARLRRLERAGAAQIEIEPVEGRGRLDVERLAEPAQIGGERARGGDRARHAGAEQRAGVDVDDFVRAGAHEADVVARHAAGTARERSRGGAPRHARRPARRLRPRRRRAPSAATSELALPFGIEPRRPCAAPRSRRTRRNSGRSAPRGRGFAFEYAASALGDSCTRSPGSAPATTRPSAATPSPRLFRASIVDSSVVSSMPRGIQEFARAVAARHRRVDQAEARPAQRLDAGAHLLAGLSRAPRRP